MLLVHLPTALSPNHPGLKHGVGKEVVVVWWGGVLEEWR